MSQVINLDRPPYLFSLELLQSLRNSDDDRDFVAFAETRTERRGTHDVNQIERAKLAHLLLFEAQPDDLRLLRFLLDEEVSARHRDSFQGAGDALTILSMLVLDFGDASDTWRFWLAKRANFDTWAGGYDIEFVLAHLGPAEVRHLLEERSPGESETLQRYDLDAIKKGIESWKTSLGRRYPRTLAAMSTADCESWAELFGDDETQLRFGLQNAPTPEARARLYRNLGRYREAVVEGRAAVEAAEEAWDQVSRLRDVMVDAARVPMSAVAEVEKVDALRHQIPSWNEVGLGRMTTQACYELAVSARDPEIGRQLWQTAERWREELADFTLVGLRAAVLAAEKWGEPDESNSLQRDFLNEQARIEAMFSTP